MINKIAYKAILIYPKFDTHNTFWSYATSLKMYAPLNEFDLPKRLLPPLGLMGLFNYLKPYYEELCLIDRNVDPSSLQDLVGNVDHVFMGGMLAQEQNMIKDAIEIQKMGKTLIVGGTVVTPDSALVDLANHLVENESETIMDELIEGLGDERAKHYYRGGVSLPEHFFQPDFQSINMQNYVHMAVQTSRGCPECCEFCDIPSRFGKAYRVTPWEHTEQSFRQIKELGWTGQVFIVDDNFIGNPRKALKILKNLYKIGEKIGYHHPKYTELTLRLADDSPIMEELRHWFHKTNFINGFYGVETPNEASLLETKKHQNLRGRKTLVEKLNFISEQTGGGVMIGMIYGFDHDTSQSVDEFIDFVNASNAPIVMAGLLNALPCTPLMNRMLEQGRYKQSSSGNNSDGIINFIPYNFSVQQAEQNYLKILKGIYHSKAYFKRVMRHLEQIDPCLQSNGQKGKESVTYVVKILSRHHALIYWRYLPKALAIAKRRCGFNTPGYMAILAEFFSLCGQYTHFVSQIKAQQNNIFERKYVDWQQVSWREKNHNQIEVMEVE